MKRILICAIARNARSHLDRWYGQLLRLAASVHGEYEVEVSIYSNDSHDGTDEWARNLPANSYGLKVHALTETLGTKQYGSVWSLDRLKQLANARQKCLDQVGDLSCFDKIAFVEPDVTYDPKWCAELILARHPHAAGLGDPDIYSGWSLRSSRCPRDSNYLYDTCATRQSANDTEWSFAENEHSWRPASLIPTYLTNEDSNCLHAVWSTFNCFCVYNAEPFKCGLKWDWANYRLDTGQGQVTGVGGHTGYLDADTSSLCESFRAHGFNKVYLNTNCLIRHA